MKSVFISYRRSIAGKLLARSLKTELKANDYEVFLDVDNGKPGVWRQTLKKEIENRSHFLLVLTEGALDRCGDPDDPVRREYEHARRTKRNVVPIVDREANVELLRKACPTGLFDPFELQFARLGHDNWTGDIGNLIRDYISPAKAPPRYNHNTKNSSSNLENRLVVLHSGTNSVEAELAKRSKLDLVEAFRNRFSDVDVLRSRSKNESQLTIYKLLRCRAAVILIDQKAIRSGFMASAISILAWRRELGLPVVVVTMPDLSVNLRDTKYKYLDLLQPISHPHHPATPAKLADVVAEQIAARNRTETRGFDPTARWLAEAVEILSHLSQEKLESLATGHLSPPSIGLPKDKLVRSLAAMLFVADLTDKNVFRDVLTFLDEVTYELSEYKGVSVARVRDFARMISPLWVDFSSSRKLLSASQTDKLCGLELSGITFAVHAIKRATASSRGFKVVPLSPTTAGENNVQELANRFDKYAEKLRGRLGDRSVAVESAHGTFATFVSSDLSPDALQKLLVSLRESFPGVTFVLVSDSDRGRDAWRKLSPRPRIAIRKYDEDTERRIKFGVKEIESLPLNVEKLDE